MPDNKPKRYGINALVLSHKFAGAGVYTRNFLYALSQNNKKDIFYVFIRKETEGKFDFLLNRKNFKLIKFKFKNNQRRILFEQTKFVKILNILNLDLLHSVSNIFPLNYKGINLLTVHDIIFKICPERYPLIKRLYYKYFAVKSIKKAEKIISVSQRTKDDIIKYFDRTENISVIYEGINRFLNIKPDCNEQEVLYKFNIKKDYMFFTGTVEPGKNIEFLKRIIYEINKIYGSRFCLVIAGNNIMNCNKEINIIYTGYIKDKELSVLYKNCRLFVYPVLYEGFGLPILEAIKFGKPIVSSDKCISSELGLDDIRIINNFEIEDWIDGIRSIIDNNITEISYKLNSKFTWENLPY